ncbi:MAG TPA: trypsin-like peptidase domain-containing protein [Methylomirabilota bacterium]|nr:trypsin-like peptidase domain-containing protein [Methylomirabilota bacterium]
MSVLSAPEALPAHLAQAADRLRQVTVEIDSAGGGGAGVVWAPDVVVTNAHVLHDAGVRLRLADDRRLEGHVIVADPRVDLALVRMPRAGVLTATPGDSGTVRVGSVVVALGHPRGLRRMLTAGVVHAVAAMPGGRRWIQAAIRLAPGNSGGPLADPAGRVVGINTLVAGGLAFAIPIDEVRRFVAAALAADR